jgi:hypothetical protein
MIILIGYFIIGLILGSLTHCVDSIYENGCINEPEAMVIAGYMFFWMALLPVWIVKMIFRITLKIFDERNKK